MRRYHVAAFAFAVHLFFNPLIASPGRGAMRFQSAARLDSFVLHFGSGVRGDTRQMTAAALRPCQPGATRENCWEIEPLGPGVNAIEARPAGRRDQVRGAIAFGAAWDEAYALREKTGAEFVEPIFEVSFETEQLQRGGDHATAPPPDDREWSVKFVDVPAAIAMLRRIGKPVGREAEGIILGHPDTGYREHPEVWDADETKSPLLFTKGWNFVEDNDRPLDPLADSGVVPNPGHGTKSGSVIISPPGKQWPSPDPKAFVTGVAPGARAIPLRVHTSVVQINSGRLAKAILHTVEPDGIHVRIDRPVDLISIAMGGLPSLALYKAVVRAEEQGVIVVAAAGNNVGLVVWPARFSQTIAVAAVNAQCIPWTGSSHGGAVDISAPGESVWHASVDGAGAFDIAPGEGTTYATGTTAGVASLWLARHAGNADVQRLKQQGRLTASLRALLQQTAWTPSDTSRPLAAVCAANAKWDSSEYGAGIVHASRLLAAPIAEPRVSSAPRGASEFPVSASLFDPRVPRDEVTSRLRELLKGASPEEQARLDVELATIYALDPAVRQRIDTVGAIPAPAPDAYVRARAAIAAADVSAGLKLVMSR